MASRIRQNFKEESEALINKQINMEFYASYVYMSMYTYFDRDDVAYAGMAAFFKKSSDEEREHGEKLIKYGKRRGPAMFARFDSRGEKVLVIARRRNPEVFTLRDTSPLCRYGR